MDDILTIENKGTNKAKVVLKNIHIQQTSSKKKIQVYQEMQKVMSFVMKLVG